MARQLRSGAVTGPQPLRSRESGGRARMESGRPWRRTQLTAGGGSCRGLRPTRSPVHHLAPAPE